MKHYKRTALLLAFSLLLLSGCTSQNKSHKLHHQSTKRYHRDCGCSIHQPNRIDIALNTFAYGK